MSNSIVTNKFDFRIIKSLEEKFQNSAESIYFFYGNPVDWSTVGSPDEPQPSNSQENLTKSNLLALKKVNDRDLILGAIRYTWKSGTTYETYTDQSDLTAKTCYVITSQNKVYKCLGNNTHVVDNPNGAASTIEPTHDGGTIVTTSDNYVWKHMFTVTEAIQRKFTSSDYIPIDVASPDTQGITASATPGTVDLVTIDTVSGVQRGGSDYLINSYTRTGGTDINTTRIPIYIDGDGDEVATGTIRINQVLSNGAINLSGTSSITGVYDLEYPSLSTTAGFEFTESTKGSGYRVPSNGDWSPIKIRQTSSETGSSANEFEFAYGVAKISDGSIQAIRIIDGGKGYSTGTAQVVQSSAIAYGTINSAGRIVSTEVDYNGQNFSRASALIISDHVSTNPVATLTPIISPFKGHGSDPEVELMATNLLFNIQIAYEELGGDFSVTNDFRSVGIIENPEQQNSDGSGDAVATALTLSAKTDITCKTNLDRNDFPADSVITGTTSGAKATIVDVIENNKIRVIRDIRDETNTVEFIANETVKVGSATAEISSITQPEYVPFSGNMLFINNRQAIQRSSDQIETINFILKI